MATPHDGLAAHDQRVMPDPFLIIVALIAIACVMLFPVLVWRRRRHRYDDDPDADG